MIAPEDWETWFSKDESGRSRVLACFPYRGRYPEMFTHVLRLSAPATRRGWIEMAVNMGEVDTTD